MTSQHLISKIWQRTFGILLILSWLCLPSCSSRQSTHEAFLRKDIDLSYVTHIAIPPLQNNTNDKYVAERLRDMVITQTLAMGVFDVVDKGITDSALAEEAVDPSKGQIDPSILKRVGQRLNVQAFLLGTVDRSEEVRRGAVSVSVLTITLRLLDIHTGTIFWQASGHKDGDSKVKRILGLNPDDEFLVANALVNELLKTITDDATSISKSEDADEQPPLQDTPLPPE